MGRRRRRGEIASDLDEPTKAFPDDSSSRDEVVAYLRYLSTDGGAYVVPHFKGVGPFRILCELGLVRPEWTTFRIMYIGIHDEHYWLREDGKFYKDIDDTTACDPEVELAVDKNPAGWEVMRLWLRALDTLAPDT